MKQILITIAAVLMNVSENGVTSASLFGTSL